MKHTITLSPIECRILSELVMDALQGQKGTLSADDFSIIRKTLEQLIKYEE